MDTHWDDNKRNGAEGFVDRILLLAASNEILVPATHTETNAVGISAHTHKMGAGVDI